MWMMKNRRWSVVEGDEGDAFRLPESGKWMLVLIGVSLRLLSVRRLAEGYCRDSTARI